MGGAGEFGHIVVQPDGPLCGCGQRGCLEAISSRTAISMQLASFSIRGRMPIIAEAANGNLKKIKSGIIAKAYNSGDKDVKNIVHHAAKYLGVGMANLVNCFNPEAVILGGGLIEALPEPFTSISADVMRKSAMEVWEKMLMSKKLNWAMTQSLWAQLNSQEKPVLFKILRA